MKGISFRRQPLGRPRCFRIGLRTFLILCGVIGSAIGIYVRCNPPKEPGYCVEEWLLDGFRINIVWLRGPDGNEKGEFAYMAAHPTGYQWRWYTLRPRGIYTNDRPPSKKSRGMNRTAGKSDCKYWIFTASYEPGVKPIEGDFPPIIPRDFNAFKRSTLWNDYMRPALIEESQRYDRWWFEHYGIRYPHSRFTSEEIWHKWLSESAADKSALPIEGAASTKRRS